MKISPSLLLLFEIASNISHNYWSYAYVECFTLVKTLFIFLAILTIYCCITVKYFSFRDNQLDPDKWTYVGSYYNSNISDGEIQNHSVSKIIPYSDQSPSVMFNEYDVALVRLEDTVKINKYPKTVCLPENDILLEQKCFTTGWSKNYSGNVHYFI